MRTVPIKSSCLTWRGNRKPLFRTGTHAAPIPMTSSSAHPLPNLHFPRPASQSLLQWVSKCRWIPVPRPPNTNPASEPLRSWSAMCKQEIVAFSSWCRDARFCVSTRMLAQSDMKKYCAFDYNIMCE